MKGQGKSCHQGVKVESFDAEIIGVLRDTSPGPRYDPVQASGMNSTRPASSRA